MCYFHPQAKLQYQNHLCDIAITFKLACEIYGIHRDENSFDINLMYLFLSNHHFSDTNDAILLLADTYDVNIIILSEGNKKPF